MAQSRIIGELAVVALEAENLPKIAGNLTSFCVFKLGNVAKRTKSDPRGGRNPTWDDQVNMPVPAGATTMIVQVMDEQKGEQLVCEGSVDLAKVLKDGEFDEWVPMKRRGQEAGDVYLELTFYAALNNPPPRRQPTRFGHPRPPAMAQGYGRPPPPMAQPYARPRPPPVHVGTPMGMTRPPAPPAQANPPPSQPYPIHQQHRPPPPTSSGSSVMSPMSASSSHVSVGSTWRASSTPRPRPPPGPSLSSGGHSPRPPAMFAPGPPSSHGSPGPTGAPLLSAPYRPMTGTPPVSHQPSYGGNNGYMYPNDTRPYPPKPLPQTPSTYPQQFEPGRSPQPPTSFPTPQPYPAAYPPGPPPPPQGFPPPPHQAGYPPHNGPPPHQPYGGGGGGYPPGPPPPSGGGYHQPGYPPY